MSYQHQQQAAGAWKKLSLVEQLANVGSEVYRADNWLKKGHHQYSRDAFFRALELLQLTKSDEKNRTSLRELCRLYEVLVDYFDAGNQYGSTSKSLNGYFLAFNQAANRKR